MPRSTVCDQSLLGTSCVFAAEHIAVNKISHHPAMVCSISVDPGNGQLAAGSNCTVFTYMHEASPTTLWFKDKDASPVSWSTSRWTLPVCIKLFSCDGLMKLHKQYAMSLVAGFAIPEPQTTFDASCSQSTHFCMGSVLMGSAS